MQPVRSKAHSSVSATTSITFLLLSGLTRCQICPNPAKSVSCVLGSAMSRNSPVPAGRRLAEARWEKRPSGVSTPVLAVGLARGIYGDATSGWGSTGPSSINDSGLISEARLNRVVGHPNDGQANEGPRLTRSLRWSPPSRQFGGGAKLGSGFLRPPFAPPSFRRAAACTPHRVRPNRAECGRAAL